MALRRGTANDPRSTRELIRFAAEARTEAARRNCISALFHRDVEDVLPIALPLCSHRDVRRRMAGATIVAMVAFGRNRYRKRLSELSASMLQQATDTREIVYILGRIGNWNSKPFSMPLRKQVVALASHTSRDVRFATAKVLGGREDRESINTLIRLMDDPSPRVRDWATFGLGDLCDGDSPRIRNALAKRLNDTDPDTQAEAVYGLVKRQEERGLEAMLAALRSGECSSLLFRAAYEYPNDRWDPALVELLNRSEREPDISPEWLAELRFAIEELSWDNRREPRSPSDGADQ